MKQDFRAAKEKALRETQEARDALMGCNGELENALDLNE